MRSILRVVRVAFVSVTVLCVGIGVAYAQAPTLDELSFRVVGFPLTSGLVKMEVFNSVRSFIEQTPFKEAESEYINRFSDNYVYVKLEGLPVGRYVIRIYHDEDENSVFDMDREAFAYYSPLSRFKKFTDEKEDISIFEEMNFLYGGGEVRALVKLIKP